MRKLLVLVLTIFLLTILATSAFAYEPVENDYKLYGNEFQGSISFGDRGYSWYSEEGGGPLPEIVQELINNIINKNLINNTNTEEVTTPEPLIDNGLQDQLEGEIGDAGEPVTVNGAYDENSSELYDFNTSQVLQDNDGDGQWYFYKDAKGVLHYFYIDPDYEGQWVRYMDENQVVQYRYELIN